MLRIAKRGATLVCEDMTLRPSGAAPNSEAHCTIKQIIYQVAARAGTDWDIGLRLYGLFASGIQNIEVGIFPSAYASGEEKRLPEYTLLELAPRLLAAGAISEVDLRRLAASARAYTERADTLVILPPMIQVWGTKPD